MIAVVGIVLKIIFNSRELLRIFIDVKIRIPILEFRFSMPAIDFERVPNILKYTSVVPAKDQT